MRRNWILVASTAALATTFVVASYSQHGRDAARVSHEVDAADSAIVIDAVSGETFSPAPVGTPSELSAAEAFQAYVKNVGATVGAPVDGTTETLGWLTLPIGPIGDGGSMTYAAKDQLVWGYATKSCPVTTLPTDSQGTPDKCMHWLFLDAATGESVDETWEQ